MPMPSVGKINAHLWAATGYCYIDLPNGRRIRISRARTRNGVVEGRVISGSKKTWEPIPLGSRVELS